MPARKGFVSSWTTEQRGAVCIRRAQDVWTWTTISGNVFFFCPTTRCIWDESFYSTWWTNEQWDACQDDICSAMWKKLSRWTTGCMWELQWLLDVVNNWPGEQGTAWGWFLFIEKLNKRTMKIVRKRFLSLRAVEKKNSEVRKKGRFLFDAMDSFADEQWDFFFNWWGWFLLRSGKEYGEKKNDGFAFFSIKMRKMRWLVSFPSTCVRALKIKFSFENEKRLCWWEKRKLMRKYDLCLALCKMFLCECSSEGNIALI